MGDGQPFWRHWIRGARVFRGVGAAVLGATLAAGGATVLVIAGIDGLAQHFLSQKFDPNGFVVLGVIAALVLLLAPAILSSRNDERSLFPAWRAGPPVSPPRPVAIEVADGLSFLDGVLCEEVRPELDGRWILLGTYGDAIVVPRFPYQLKFSGLLNVETTKAFLDPLPARIRFDERVVALTKLVSKAKIGSWTIQLIQRVVDVTEPGTLHVEIGIDGETWTEVMRKPVRGAPDET